MTDNSSPSPRPSPAWRGRTLRRVAVGGRVFGRSLHFEFMKILQMGIIAVAMFVTAAALAADNTASLGEGMVYKKFGEQELHLYLVKPDGWKASDRRPGLVLFHGGSWTGGTPALLKPQADYFASRGMVCLLAEYRLLNSKSNAPPIECVQDAKSAMRWARSHASELGLDPQRLGAAGGSAGGHLAAFTGLVNGLDDPGDDLSVSPKPAALVLFNPVFNNGPGQWGHGRVGERFKEFSPAHNITSNAPPTIVLLGREDRLISVKTVEDFQVGMTQAGARCETRFYDGVGHTFFNREPHRTLTLIEADEFLASLGWLEGPPMITAPAAHAKSATEAESATQRGARMKWWREARFGMFVHWGLYSGLAGNWNGKIVGTKGGMEWLQNRVGADTFTYASNALPLFKPKPGFAAEWARLAKEAGCRYVVFTTKHHDGFALHDSKIGDYNAGSRLNRDLVKEIVEALRAEGLRVGFYHSMIDWHHDQYDYTLAKGLPYPGGNKSAMPGPRDQAKYIAYLHGQVDELVSNYGRVDILWWDYSSKEFQGNAAWRASELIQKVRSRQPAIVMNNRLFRTPEAGWVGNGMQTLPTLDSRFGDFTTPEQHIPATGMPGVDWETCMTMNTTWGFNEHDLAWKSDETLIRNLVDIASKGGNYLLNIGPTGDGSVPPESVKALRAIGAWMKVNGESIYGTTANPFAKLDWGTCTKKITENGGTLYLHILAPPSDGRLVLPGLRNRVQGARLLVGSKLEVVSDAAQTVIMLPQNSPVQTNAVVAVDFAGRLEVKQP